MDGLTFVKLAIVLTLGRPGLCLLNLSIRRPTTSSDFRSGKGPSHLVVDGNDSDLLDDPNNSSIPQCLYTIENQKTAFWQVDLQSTVIIDHVEVTFRKGGPQGQQTHQKRRNGYSIFVTSSAVYLPVIPATICYSDRDPSLSAANHENRSCSNTGNYVTFYNERNTLSGSNYSPYAVLELCEVKVMGCPVTKHGVNCSEDCPAQCSNNLCFPGNGTCVRGCKPGYTGSKCEKPCDDYFFGQDCTSDCYCKAGPCAVADGKCPQGGCDPGYYGTSCSTECINGTFGDNCGSQCGHCIDGRTTCNHRDGACRVGCSPGYKVHTCIEVCNPGTYGSGCDSSCGLCFNGKPCHHINGSCLAGCAPGKMGNRCVTDCIPSKYGPNCINTCGECKGGQDTCNIKDGSCPGGCAAGWQGSLCKTACEQGRYGMKCAEQCGECRDGRTCNRFNGTCENGCSPGWNGGDCKQECPFGWYGEACREKCGSCADGNKCNHVDGRCPKIGRMFRCDPGLKGEKCKIVCSNTEYGRDCSQVCGQCFNSSCESVSGNCTQGCTEGWSGGLCTERLTNTPASAGGIIGGIAGTIVAIIILVIVLVVVIKRRQQKPYSNAEHLDSDREHGDLFGNVAANSHLTDTADHTNQVMYENVGNVSRNDEHQSGVLKEKLFQEITRKEEYNEFEMDFKEFLTGKQFPCEEATKTNNKSRNRYKTTFPYDHSRVQLDGDQNYINANFIKDLDGTNAYVATQGPKNNTLGDFWQMIWQLKTGKIVMLANCVELGKPKVEQYWPDDGSSISHGGMKISFISSKQQAAYTVRKLKLENKKIEKTRVITQFHFLKWPDHGTPDVMHFALLLLHVDSVKSKLSGPVVVHCSAGVGRTGTFIASDVLYRHGIATGWVDPPAYVRSMRQDRMDMVQTKSQYTFIYDALVELFLIDNTKLTIGDFGSNSLNSSRLLQEYKKLNEERPNIHEDLLSNGLMPQNQMKNRNPETLPSDKHRPLLTSHPANKTDYINAVFLPTVERYEGYIATQWPLPETAEDFWAMIYDYRSTAVVILDSDADNDDPNLMPSEEESVISAGIFSVQTISDPWTEDSIAMTEVYLSKMGDQESQKLKIFRMCDWPYDKPTCPEGCVTRITYASQEWQRNVTSAGPITVVCRNGALKSGMFCTVANAIEHINLNQHVSLVQVVRQLQLRRPSFINTYESYVMCCREIKVHFDSLSEYQNYEGPSLN